MIITSSTKKKKKEEQKQTPIKGTPTVKQKQNEDNSWVKSTIDTQRIKDAWSDGYQVGDISKTIIGAKNIVTSATKDVATNIGKGFMSTVEGTVDAGRYLLGSATKKSAEIQADIWDLFGNESYANSLRKAGQDVYNFEKKNAQYDVTANLLGEQNDIFKTNWSKQVDSQSILGNKADSVSQGIGNVAAFVGLGSLTGGSTLGTFANSFASAYGNTRNEAYKNGADDKTANRAAWISGLSEAISEQFFSGIPGMKTAGWGDALSGKLSNSVAKFFGSKAGKAALTLFDGLGEGSEEIISNILNAMGTDVMHYIDKNYTYGMENMSGNIGKDAIDAMFSQDSLDSFVSAMFTSVLTGGGKQLTQNIVSNNASNRVANQGNMTKQQATQLLEQIAEKRANLELDENANYKEKTETIENEKTKLAKEIKQAVKEGQQVDLNELLNQTPNSRQEMQFTLDQDEFKNVKSDKQKVLANDMTRLNNVKENHELFKTVNAIQGANNTQQYHITTTEGLYEMGIVNKDANGNYTMPDGSPYVPRGLNYKDGDIYINADVGNQSGTQAMYHEMFEGFKKASPNEYKQFKQMVKDIVGEESIQESIQEYTKMYGEELTDNIEDEIINDKFGELAESQDFINRISDNRTLLQKFIDTVKNMINYVKGTEEERKLIKLQKELEKQFAKRYKATDFSQNKGETAYSLADRVTGDQLLDAQDLIDEVKSVGANVDENGYITLYHQTSKENADKIKQSGIMTAKEDAVFFSTSKDAQQSQGRGEEKLEFKIPAEKLLLDDLFSDNADVKIPLNGKGQIDVSEYLVDNTKTNYRGSHQIENAKSITELNLDDVKNKVIEIDGYLTNQAQSDLKKLQKILNNPNDTVKIYRAAPVNELNSGDWVTTDRSYAQNVANNNGGKVYTFEVKASDLYYPDNVRELPSLHRLSSFQYNGENTNQTKYSLSKDNGIQTINDYLNLNNYTFNNNGVLTVNNLTDRQIKDLVKIYHTTGYEDVSTDYLVNRLKEGNMPLQREVADRFIEKELGYKPTIDTTQVFEDAEGNPLTKEQIEFYKDSAVRDIRGRLIPVYHRTNAEFTEFDSKAGTQHGKKYGKGFYFSTTPENYGNNTMKLYLNAKEGEFKYVPKMGYYIVQNPNQIKNVDNKTPTSSNDIRYSLATNKDSEGRTLSKEQQEYFKDSKVVDENGNLLLMHNGRYSNDTIFKPSEWTNEKNGPTQIKGYFATDSEYSEIYGDVSDYYLNIKNPLYMGVDGQEAFTLDEWQQFFKEHGVTNAEFDSSLYGPNTKGNFVDENGNKRYLPFEIVDSDEYWNNDGNVTERIKAAGYDGLTWTEGGKAYMPFESNQIKNVDNLNPTKNDDIRLSLTSNENIDSKEIAPIGTTQQETTQTIQNELSPIREDLSNITEQMNNLSNQIETLQNGLNTQPSGYVETYNEQRNENIPTRQLTEEDANTLQDALLNDEGYLRSLNEEANLNTENTKLIDRLTNNITQRLDLEKGQKQTLRNIVKDAIENEYSADEISQALQKEFSKMSYEMTNGEAIDAKKLIKEMPIDVSDAIKKDIADYGKWKQSNFGKINFSKSGGDVDTVYAELNSRMPYYFPSDITNPTDQLLRIAEVANMAKNTTETIDIESDEFDSIADYIKNTTLEDEYNAQMQSDYDLEKNIQFNMNEDIAPTTIRTQESIDDYIQNRDIAPINPNLSPRRTEQQVRNDNAKRTFREMFINRYAAIDDYSKTSGNRDIKFYADKLGNAQSEATFNINNKQTDINGNWIGKGLDEIFKPIEDAGLSNAFNDYLFNKSNIERHAVGKGSVVPVEVSRQLVKQYEIENPEFKEKAQEVYDFIDNYSREQVDSGILSQDKYDNFRGEFGIYGEYVPFKMEDFDRTRYYDDSGEAKSVSTFKRSKGGASDVSGLMSMKDAIANQVRASKNAVAFNELAKQIVQTNGTDNNVFDVDSRTDITSTNDSLYRTEDGDYLLSAYIDGEKVSTKISEELYNELARTNENRIRQLEEDFSSITNPLQKASNIRRKLLTTWNPVFLARNAIKDIQDAVINSKHTTDMLKNYFRVGNKSVFTELKKAQTKEAQQFLALYGADNLYGDYSKKGNWFTKANELIELAPRFAEFKASLQNGESVQEAIYNAREVTTNFGRGGYITKALNRNGFTFLNANVQGLDKLVRNISGENGVKGVTSVVVKGAAFAVLPSILNHLLYGLGDDKDEEYEALPDYIKDNYYLIKTDGNNFVRIPKGRINAVFGSLARRMMEAGEGESFDAKEWADNAWSQIGVGDSGGLQTIFTPLKQAFGSKNGEAWYGGDIVPTRLQNKPAGEQYDEKTDVISKKLGELFNVSPKKINYVLDQYSGGIGDVLLPMITPATSSGAEKPHEFLLAPIKDAFVVNSTDDNKYAGDFYDAKDKAQIQSNSENATDEDKLRYKYMSSVSKQMSDLYKERREVQSDTTLSNKQKYAKVQAIQNEINNLAKEGLSKYNNFTNTDNYSSIGDTEYYKNAEGEWTKVSDDEQEFTAGLNDAEKTSYYRTKNKINDITQDYSAKTKGLAKDDPKKTQYSAERKENITQAITNSGLDNNTKAMIYSKYYSNKDTMTNAVNAGYNIDTYITALNDIEQIRNKYSQKNGYTTEERKQRTIAYINSLEMEIPQKAMMIRQYYTSFREYNNDIVNFVGNLNIPYEDKKAILEGTGMTVNGNNVSWK